MAETYAQRMRVTFATDDTVKYVGHLDMHRAWERAIRRARLPLAYTQGFNPQPRLQFAAALPVGFTGEAEVADIFLNEALEPADFLARLTAALPPGIRPYHAEPVPREAPSLQSQVCGATYRVEVEADEPAEAFAARLAAFLARPEAWRTRRKGQETARYDLRPLVQALTYLGPCELGHAFEVVMRAEPGATGRPDELLAELGLEAASRRIVRVTLAFMS
ncbi:MAG: TIGR03936 family radical SAM-associated protein [Anaerolineae bacterium]